MVSPYSVVEMLTAFAAKEAEALISPTELLAEFFEGFLGEFYGGLSGMPAVLSSDI